ncbi:MAG: AAA family ATPase [Methanomassiliicoccales archaeon]|nr:AAA family ATPase [Methanomassiliicoccales archaeon]MDD1755879.1 AAA family ATPase [Methanomassiliicoccales archaeon]
MAQELTYKECRNICPEVQFKCRSTEELTPLTEIIGQDRAARALQFGLRIQNPGFNVYVSGLPGTGRKTAITNFIRELAKHSPVPSDWCYVNNFHDSSQPDVIPVPAGLGIEFKREMDNFVSGTGQALREAFESNEYAQKRQATLRTIQEDRTGFIDTMNKMAADAGFQIVQSPIGLMLAPVMSGQAISEEQLSQLPLKTQKEIETKRQELQVEVQKSLIQLRDIDRKAEEIVNKLNREIAAFVLQPRLLGLRKRFKDNEEVIGFIGHVEEDILNNIGPLLQAEAPPQPGPLGIPMPQDGPKRNYGVNLIVDNSKLQGAPVEIEMNPSYFRLFGAAEKEAKFGALFTDYTMIRGGAAHRANGGFLVLPVEGLFLDPLAWPTLKQTLSSGKLEIEEPAARMGYMVTKSLRPEPIPFKAKVILLGDPYAYDLLYSMDKDFRELFKVKAEFDTTMDRNEENVTKYAAFVCTICQKEGLLHVDPAGLAAIVEYSSRLVEDQNKLATLFAEVANVIREADFYAKEEKSKNITRDHINKALEEKVYRSNMIQKKIQEAIAKKLILIETKDAKVGQVNGLSVMGVGDYAFGMPSRITASVGVGKEGIINIEREIAMSGPSHSKGVLILGGYLNDTYAKEKPLGLTAKLTFEQSYSGVDGDSASSTELYALLSALSGKPINQSIAVTGSVNQKGEVQAIGGVNFKIEGFFEVCKLFGLTGDQGVMIPQSNVQNLMLKDEVLGAIKKKKFHVWSVATIDEGIQLLTGTKAGSKRKDGSFDPGSINDLVKRRFDEMAEKVKEYRG